jgi:FkbM family methyltransferase
MPQFSEQPGLVQFLEAREIEVVFDVGANEGFFGLFLRQEGYRGRIVSFEPIRDTFRVLAARAEEDGNWEAYQVGLGEAPGSAVINVAESSVFSSLLAHRSAALSFDARAAPARTEEITIDTLDRYASGYSDRKCFLKIDTQGYERQVLLGAQATLPTLFGAQMELPIIHLYSGVWGLYEGLAFMAEQGFVVAQIHPVNHHHLDPVSWVEADCVFRRADPRID